MVINDELYYCMSPNAKPGSRFVFQNYSKEGVRSGFLHGLVAHAQHNNSKIFYYHPTIYCDLCAM